MCTSKTWPVACYDECFLPFQMVSSADTRPRFSQKLMSVRFGPGSDAQNRNIYNHLGLPTVKESSSYVLAVITLLLTYLMANNSIAKMIYDKQLCSV